MIELEAYDNAVAKHHKKTNSCAMPLLSWDLYSQNFSLITSFKDDLSQLTAMSKNWDFEADYQKELTILNKVIIVTSPRLEIVYASHNIKKMNGYESSEVVGNTPQMFQGKDTCQKVLGRIQTAIQNELPFHEVVANYRKDNSLYNCRIKGFPIYGKRGNLLNYIAFEQVA